MLKIDNLTYRIGERILLDSVNATIHPGAKVGLVGRNGTGKTTLFRLITGVLQADSGTVEVPARWRVGITTQDAPSGPQSLIDTVLGADRELTTLWQEAEHATDPHRIAEVHEALAHRDAHTAGARAARILAGLGFDEAAQQRPCDSFSGGWRMRVALAALLFTKPDLLLLDEPTNHLDLEAVLWFEDYIARYEGTVVLISHDRDLLNVAVEQIVHLDGAKLATYRGNYDRFEETRRLQAELNAKQRTKQAAQRAHMEAFVARFRYKATKAKQAQSRLKMLARLEPLSEMLEDRAPNFMFPEIAELAPPLYSLEKVEVGYDGTPVLKNISLRLDNDDRIALLGANGNGKSRHQVVEAAGGIFLARPHRTARSGDEPGRRHRRQASARHTGSGTPPPRRLRIFARHGAGHHRPALGRRARAPAVRADRAGQAAYSAARRADQPSRHGLARSADPGD
jgi:ATP-binding cassette subfamily F protein 3